MSSIAANAASLCPTCSVPLSIELNAKPANELDNYQGPTSGVGVTAAGHARRGILSRLDLARFQSSTKVMADDGT